MINGKRSLGLWFLFLRSTLGAGLCILVLGCFLGRFLAAGRSISEAFGAGFTLFGLRRGFFATLARKSAGGG